MHIVSLPTTPNMIGYGDVNNSPILSTATASSSSSSADNQLKSPHRQRRIVSASDKRSTSLQLTPLWEHVLRTQTFPDTIDIHHLFKELSERLQDPEWEVRQHALRVLIDVIPVIPECLDQRISLILGDLVYNLGHPAPAVRKGALDCLRVYLVHSNSSDEVLQTIAYEGLENISDQHLQGNVTVGLILAFPSLIFPRKSLNGNLGYPSLKYIVRLLTRKLVQVTFQEVALRTLVKIRQIVGDELFEECLDDLEMFDKNEFYLLCQVYNVSDSEEMVGPRINFQMSGDINMNKRIMVEPNLISSKFSNNNNDSSSESIDSCLENHQHIHTAVVPFPPTMSPSKNSSSMIIDRIDDEFLPDGKVILKTEIKLNSETAITMTILEEKDEQMNNENLDNDESEDEELNNDDGVIKVLTDSELDDDYINHRRTPRRVRFGGEVVKLRTPDSDTASPSDEDHSTKSTTTTTTEDTNNDIIEVTMSTDITHTIVPKSNSTTNNRSFIPVPITPATRIPQIKFDIRPVQRTSSAPSSPIRSIKSLRRNQLIYQSTPDLTKKYFTSQKNSNIPQQRYSKSSPATMSYKPKTYVSTPRKQSRADDVFSPVPVHEEVEVLHNLQRKYDNESTRDDNLQELSKIEDSKKFGMINVSNGDDEESLTSSSGSASSSCNEKNWEDLNLLDYEIIADIQNKEDWRCRVRGREALLAALQSRDISNGIESRAASFLHFLFTSDKHPRVVEVTLDILHHIIDSWATETLQARLPKLVAGLARFGGPASIKLSVQLMQKLTPAIVAEQFVSNHLLTGRNSKVKENAMQIVIYTVLKFPSTEFNVASLVTRVAVALIDRKRRVRQAALETLAVLGQIGSIDLVLDAVLNALNNLNYYDKEEVLEAVKARLVRRQLPTAGEYYVSYTPMTDTQGADINWIYAGIGSLSPSSAKLRATALYRNMLHSAEPIFYHTNNNSNSGNNLHLNPWEDDYASLKRLQEQRPKTTGTKIQLNQIYREQLMKLEEAIKEKRTELNTKPHTSLATLGKRCRIPPIVPTLHHQDEIKPLNLNATQFWTFDQQFTNNGHNNQSNGTSNILVAPLQRITNPIFKSESNERSTVATNTTGPIFNNDHNHNGSNGCTDESKGGRGGNFPPLNNNREKYSGEDYNGPQHIIAGHNIIRQIKTESTFSSESSDSQLQEQRGSRDSRREYYQSNIPVPISKHSNRSRFYGLQRTDSRYKIPSAPASSYDRKNDENFSKSPEFIRQTISSGSEIQHFYNTPPAESYLPPIDLNTKQISEHSATSIHSEPFTSSVSSPTASLKSVSNTQLSREVEDLRDDTSSSAYVTSERSTSFDSSPAKSEKKVSDSDFEFNEDASSKLQETESVSDGYKSASSEKLSNTTNFSNTEQEVEIVHTNTSASVPSLSQTKPTDEIIQRKNNSAPTQTSTDYINEAVETSRLAQSFTAPTITKSLPNSTINLNETAKISPEQTKKTLLLKRQQKNARQTAGRLLNSGKYGSSRLTSTNTKVAPIPNTSQPFEKPKEAYHSILNQLENPNWETIIIGLQNLVRLLKFHPEMCENQMHHIANLLARHIRNLRSQVARSACLVAAELFKNPRKSLELEMEEIAAPLLHRTADTNRFLRLDANIALDSMCANMPPTRVVSILAARGAMHQNAIVRCTTARLLRSLVERLGYEKIFSLPRETRDRILLTSANLLTEGSLETRNHVKEIFKILIKHPNFQKVLTDVVPACTLRHISKTLKSLK